MFKNEYDICVSAPGRITLFGEHQDYFGLPVIPAAINLRIYACGKARQDNIFRVILQDTGQVIKLKIGKIYEYSAPREYIKSGFNVIQKEGFTFSRGYDCFIKGYLPISAGLSSSSALTVAWIKFLLSILDIDVSPLDLARLAHKAEVLEFNEPGGMQDHISSSFGYIVYFLPAKNVYVERLNRIPGYFIVVDTLTPKPTLEILSRVKGHVLSAKETLEKSIGKIDLLTIPIDEVNKYAKWSIDFFDELVGILRIRDNTEMAKNEIKKKRIDPHTIGELLQEQHKILRDNLNVSTKKIEKILKIGYKLGALGGKLIGSGGGGCVLIYSIEDIFEELKQKLESIDVNIYNVSLDEGARVEKSH